MADATTAATTAATTDATAATTAATTTVAAATTATTAATTTAAATTDTATAAAATTTAASDDWRASLPDDLKEHASRFTSTGDLVKSHLTLRQQLSKAIIPPGKDAKPEDVAAYNKALGVPDTADGYKFPAVEGEVLTDEQKTSRAAWGKRFHDANVPATVAEKLLADFYGDVTAQQTAIVAADKKNAEMQTEALRKDWGADFDRNKEFANRAFKDLAERSGVSVEELRAIETKTGQFMFDDARMLKVFALLGREMGEGNLGPVVSDTERSSLESALRANRSEQATAKSNRDEKRRNDLYLEEQKIITRIQGNRPIVGSAGRAA